MSRYSWRYGIFLTFNAALLAALVWCLFSASIAYANTITVNTTDDELNADGDCSLREAIQAANTDAAVDGCAPGNGADVIHLPAGTYTLTLTGVNEDHSATGDLDVRDDLTLRGDGAATTVIQGGGGWDDRILHVISGTAVVSINAVTVQGGNLAQLTPTAHPMAPD